MNKFKSAKQFEKLKHFVEAVEIYQSIIDKNLNAPKALEIISALETIIGVNKRKKAEKRINAIFANFYIPSYSSNAIGEMYCSNRKINRNYVKALQWFYKAEAEGSVGAIRNIGLMYESGHGLVKNYVTAAKYYQKAIEAGLNSAQLYLNDLSKKNDITSDQLCEIGKMFYLKGKYKKAAEWYEKAIEKGSAIAYKYMGMCSEFGKGVPKNYLAAARCYYKAQERNYKIGLTDIERIMSLKELDADDLVLVHRMYESAMGARPKMPSILQGTAKNEVACQNDNLIQPENKNLEKEILEDKDEENYITCAC